MWPLLPALLSRVICNQYKVSGRRFKMIQDVFDVVIQQIEFLQVFVFPLNGLCVLCGLCGERFVLLLQSIISAFSAVSAVKFLMVFK